MSEYIYETNGNPVASENGKISLAREEIVRCRDCIQCDFLDSYGSKPAKHVCSNFEYSEVALDGFCAWGEKRND